MVGNVYFHKPSGYYLRLVIFRGLSNVNTYLQVDKEDNPIIEKRKWSSHLKEQKRLVTGFNELKSIL